MGKAMLSHDFQFIAGWLMTHYVKPNLTHNGQKILQLEVTQNCNIFRQRIVHANAVERFSNDIWFD